jgi:two-component system, OmpR family, KDP operon response regulator KdpE
MQATGGVAHVFCTALNLFEAAQMKQFAGSVLLVGHDTSFRRTLRRTLDANDFDVVEAVSVDDALRRLRRLDYEVVLLDMNMPSANGIETCRRIRGIFARLPIVMFTKHNSQDERVRALEGGADSYMTRPFQTRELVAVLRSAVRRGRASEAPFALLREINELIADPVHHRVKKASVEIYLTLREFDVLQRLLEKAESFVADAPLDSMVLSIGGIMMDPVRHLVEKAGVEVHLTPREFDLLRCLMEHAGRPVAYARLNSIVRGPGFGENRDYLRVMVGNLRKKLEDDPSSPVYLFTDSYIGYRFRAYGVKRREPQGDLADVHHRRRRDRTDRKAEPHGPVHPDRRAAGY